MKRLLVLLALVAACGGSDSGGGGGGASLNLTGNWTCTLALPNGNSCNGTMALTQSATSLSGGWTSCGDTGSLTGALHGTEVSLTVAIPGFASILISGTAATNRIDGVANGSGFTGQAFHAIR